MKVDFDRKIIEIEIGDNIKNLINIIDKYKLKDFVLEPKQYYTYNNFTPCEPRIADAPYPGAPPTITYSDTNK